MKKILLPLALAVAVASHAQTLTVNFTEDDHSFFLDTHLDPIGPAGAAFSIDGLFQGQADGLHYLYDPTSSNIFETLFPVSDPRLFAIGHHEVTAFYSGITFTGGYDVTLSLDRFEQYGITEPPPIEPTPEAGRTVAIFGLAAAMAFVAHRCLPFAGLA